MRLATPNRIKSLVVYTRRRVAGQGSSGGVVEL